MKPVIEGRPDMIPAHWGRRLVALILDNLVAAPGYFIYTIPGVVLFAFRDSLIGKDMSLGRKAVDQLMVDAKTGDMLSVGRKFSRNLTAILLRAMTFGTYTLAELIVSLARDDKRCITDLMFQTVVVEIQPTATSNT